MKLNFSVHLRALSVIAITFITLTLTFASIQTTIASDESKISVTIPVPVMPTKKPSWPIVLRNIAVSATWPVFAPTAVMAVNSISHMFSSAPSRRENISCFLKAVPVALITWPLKIATTPFEIAMDLHSTKKEFDMSKKNYENEMNERISCLMKINTALGEYSKKTGNNAPPVFPAKLDGQTNEEYEANVSKLRNAFYDIQAQNGSAHVSASVNDSSRFSNKSIEPIVALEDLMGASATSI
ncbi:MAG: hypothetical protein HQK49_18120 [Oligoflexia bacterium]|nr:hypothetical protein [Oligoflexia bacterium]